MDYRAEGLSIVEIARRTGRTNAGAYKVLKRLAKRGEKVVLSLPQNQREPKSLWSEKVRKTWFERWRLLDMKVEALRIKGMNLMEIQNELKITYDAVNRSIKRLIEKGETKKMSGRPSGKRRKLS